MAWTPNAPFEPKPTNRINEDHYDSECTCAECEKETEVLALMEIFADLTRKDIHHDTTEILEAFRKLGYVKLNPNQKRGYAYVADMPRVDGLKSDKPQSIGLTSSIYKTRGELVKAQSEYNNKSWRISHIVF